MTEGIGPLAIMEPQQLQEPLLSEPKPEPFCTGPVIITSILVVIALTILIISPSCDQPLVLWTECFIGLAIALAWLESVKKPFGKKVYKFAKTAAFVLVIALAVWGHLLVFSSKTCASVLWGFAFIFIMLVDVLAFLCVLACLNPERNIGSMIVTLIILVFLVGLLGDLWNAYKNGLCEDFLCYLGVILKWLSFILK